MRTGIWFHEFFEWCDRRNEAIRKLNLPPPPSISETFPKQHPFIARVLGWFGKEVCSIHEYCEQKYGKDYNKDYDNQ